MPGRLIMMRRPGNDAPNERISLAGEIAHLAGGAVEEEREGADARRIPFAVEDRDFPVDERVAAGLLGPRAGGHHRLGGVNGRPVGLLRHRAGERREQRGQDEHERDRMSHRVGLLGIVSRPRPLAWDCPRGLKTVR